MLYGFKMGETFPTNDMVSSFIAVLSVSFNDVLLANELMLKPESKERSTNGKKIYFFRLACAHLREVAQMMNAYCNENEIKEFLHTLPDQTIEDYDVLMSAFQNGGFVHKYLMPLRNVAFHYPKCKSKGYNDLQSALQELANEEVYAELKSPKTLDFRAIYADEIQSKLTIKAFGGDEEFIDLLPQVSSLMAHFIRFSNMAIMMYFKQRSTTFVPYANSPF